MNLENNRWLKKCYFVTRIRKRWWSTATTIINITDGKIEKNSAETTDYKSIVQHVMIKYPEHYNNFVDECKESGLIKKESELSSLLKRKFQAKHNKDDFMLAGSFDNDIARKLVDLCVNKNTDVAQTIVTAFTTRY